MAFTVFDSFAEVYDDFDASDPEDLRDRAMLADAIMMYGLHGVEADLPKHLRRVFKALTGQTLSQWRAAGTRDAIMG